MKTTWAAALMALGFMLGATGCVVPTTHFDSGYARTNVVQQTQKQFVPGQTTRTEVILALGEPDAVSSDEQQLAYRSEKVVAFWAVGGYGGGTGGSIYQNRFYVFDFDPQGNFKSAARTGQYGMVEGAKEMQLNSPAFNPGGSNCVIATIAGQPVQREYPKCFWLAGVEGFRSKGATANVGEPGRLLLTESNMAVVTASQFANTKPVFTRSWGSVARARVDGYFLGQRLVVWFDHDEVHTFTILQPGGTWQDKRAMQTVCDFIQTKIKPIPAEK